MTTTSASAAKNEIKQNKNDQKVISNLLSDILFCKQLHDETSMNKDLFLIKKYIN